MSVGEGAGQASFRLVCSGVGSAKGRLSPPRDQYSAAALGETGRGALHSPYRWIKAAAAVGS